MTGRIERPKGAGYIRIWPEAGLFAGAYKARLEYVGRSGVDVRYTLDGSEPGAGAAKYTNILTLTQSATAT